MIPVKKPAPTGVLTFRCSEDFARRLDGCAKASFQTRTEYILAAVVAALAVDSAAMKRRKARAMSVRKGPPK